MNKDFATSRTKQVWTGKMLPALKQNQEPSVCNFMGNDYDMKTVNRGPESCRIKGEHNV